MSAPTFGPNPSGNYCDHYAYDAVACLRCGADRTDRPVPAHIQTLRDERAANPVYQTWRLCLDCSMAPDDRHHQPGYKMERSPWDTPGHEYVAPPEPEPEPAHDPTGPEHDPTGRGCAIAGRVLRRDTPMTGDACPACLSDTVPPMLAEVYMTGREATLTIGTTTYAVKVFDAFGDHRGFILTGPRGAEYTVMPYVDQPSPGVLHLYIVNRSWRTPSWAQGLTFLYVGGRLGAIR
jgi:hypothetical protein